MTPLDPMLPVEPGSAADRILRDHRAMEALRRHRINVVDWAGFRFVADSEFFAAAGTHQFADPADAILACAAAIEAASRDSGQ